MGNKIGKTGEWKWGRTVRVSNTSLIKHFYIVLIHRTMWMFYKLKKKHRWGIKTDIETKTNESKSITIT